jgi:chemotaxis protein MotB
MKAGLEPARLAVIGLGEHRPIQPNDTPEGRNANRRVVLVILGGNGMPEGDYGEERGAPEEPLVVEPEPLTSVQAPPPLVGVAGS